MANKGYENLPTKKAEIKEIEEKREIASLYGDGLVYSRDRVIAAAKEKLSQLTDNAVIFGKYLIWLQAEENFQPAGKPLAQILREHFTELSQATAYNFMRLAKASIEHPYFYESIKHKTKTIALLEALDDEEIKELERGGIVAEIKLDEIDRTPRRELEARCRKHDKDKERGQEQLREKEAKIAELEKKLSNREDEFSDLPEVEKQGLRLLHDFHFTFEKAFMTMKEKIPYKSAPEVCLRQLYFFLLYIGKRATDERLALNEIYKDAEEAPWETWDEMLPQPDVLIDNLPLTAGLGERFRQKMAEKAALKAKK